MKKTPAFIFFLNLYLLILCSCGHSHAPANRHANWNDSVFRSDTTSVDTVNGPYEYCFVSLAGALQKDSSYVNLAIHQNKVIGKYSWIPFEKDSRTGSITGTKRGDTIDVVWHFVQEGMTDTLRTVFLLKGNVLKQKDFTLNPKTGRQVTDDRSKFSISYQKIACPPL